MTRQVILDTETTGISSRDHRIVEIGCIEMIDRKLTGNTFHVYINPEKQLDQEVINIHGLTNAFLADKPTYDAVAQPFYDFIKGAELVIHNAPFDVGFINMENARLKRGNPGLVTDFCTILDTLVMAREKHPGQKNSLDALCKRYFVDNSMREKHGALLDAEILAEVYLAMTGGQTHLWGQDDGKGEQSSNGKSAVGAAPLSAFDLPLIQVSDADLQGHAKMLALLDKKSDGAIWHKRLADSDVDGLGAE